MSMSSYANKERTNVTNSLEIKGFNGSGKTTLLKDVIKKNYGITTLLVNNLLLNNITVVETVIDILIRYKEIKTSIYYINNCLYTIGMNSSIFYRYYYTLSTGQKKKVVFVLLLTENNFIWYIDEPQNYLDKLTIYFFLKKVSEHLNRGGIVLIAKTNNVEMAYNQYRSTISLSRFELLTTRLSSECSTTEL